MNNNHAKTNSSNPQPGYKKTKIGWIPQEWKVKKIGTLTSKVGSGSTPRGGERVYTDEGIPFIRSQNVNLDRLIMDDIRFIPLDIHEKMSSTKVSPNDVLLNITGASIGRSCVVPPYFDEGNVNQHVCIIRAKDELESLFLQSYLSSYDGQKAILRSQVGGNREGLNHKNVRSILIPLPPLPEQQKIASILSTWDATIRKLDRLIERKQTLKKGLMQQLLTGRRRFPEFVPAGGTRYQETKLGMVPEDWEVVKLGSICKKITKGTTPTSIGFQYESSGVNFIKAENIFKSGFINIDSTANISTKCNEAMSRSKLSEGDILFSIAGTLGRVALVTQKDLPANTNQALSIIKGVDLKSLKFILHFLKSYQVKKYIQRITGIGAQPNLSLSQVGKIIIPSPKSTEQNRIAGVLSSCDKEIEKLKSKKQQLEQQKKGLMQQLLTGAVRVKT